MIVLQTERLRLRHMEPGDAEFMLGLLNDPGWHRFIGDHGIRTVDGAREHIVKGPIAMVARLGFGFYLVERKADGRPLGLCGLAKRDFLDDVDIGYAFLPQHWGRGYAFEAARGVLAHAKHDIGLKRIVATVRAENAASIKLLEKLGLRFERTFQAPDSTRELQLFAMALAP